jgi:hypothetical protein
MPSGAPFRRHAALLVAALTCGPMVTRGPRVSAADAHSQEAKQAMAVSEADRAHSSAPDWTDRMERRRRGPVTLYYSPQSKPLAGDLLAYAFRCNEYLAGLFQPEEPVRQTVYWMARADWRGKPESYGFPYANGPNAYLAAADVDLPTQLALIADCTAIQDGGEAIDRMARLVGLPEGAGPAEVYERLSESSDFFVVWTAYQILPHELTHGYCNALGYPGKPRWWYEGLAQWAAYQMQTKLRSKREAEMIYEYYQLLWDRAAERLQVREFAEADRLGAGGMDTPNYAWYHAGLLRMFRDLEALQGDNPLPDLVRVVGERYKGQRQVSHAEMIDAFSEVIGRDLQPWFKEQWHLGP